MSSPKPHNVREVAVLQQPKKTPKKKTPSVYGVKTDAKHAFFSTLYEWGMGEALNTLKMRSSKFLPKPWHACDPENPVLKKVELYSALLAGVLDTRQALVLSEAHYSREELETLRLAQVRLAAAVQKRETEQYKSETIGWIMKNTIDLSESLHILDAFNEVERAKLIIYYNNKNSTFWLRFKVVPETGIVPEVRARIEKWEGEKARLSTLLKFIKRLKFGEFPDEAAFRKALNGINSLTDFDILDWRDRPIIVQFAVGENVLIEDPYCHDDSQTNCLRFYTTDEDRSVWAKSHPMKKWADSVASELTSHSKSLPSMSDLVREDNAED